MGDPANRQILEEASAWFVEFRTESVNVGRREEFMDWLRRSPDHIRAYLEISRTYVRLPGEGDMPASEAGRLLSKARARTGDEVVSFDIHRSSDRLSNGAVGFPAGRRVTGLPLTLAASFLLLLVGAFGLWSVTQRGLYTTEAGEERTVTLADGSRIELNGRTRLRVALNTRERDVRLIEGQALFQVAKDKWRPFIVDTGTAQIRAVGTAFDVHKEGADITVTVLEGTVAVMSSASSPASAAGQTRSANLMVSAGEQAVVTPQGSLKPRATNVSAATAWTRGQLEFDETPLTQVAEEFNRSSPRPLVLAGSVAGNVRISGVYSSVDPSSLILFLRSQPDLDVIESPGQIFVSSKTR
jgi:transmembrane sensor